MDLLIVGVVVFAVLVPFVAAIVVAVVWTRLGRRRLAQPVAGTMTVTAIGSPTQGELVPTLGDLAPAHEDFLVQGLVTVPGSAAYPGSVRDAAWTHRWPRVGDVLPVEVDRADPARVRIRWDGIR